MSLFDQVVNESYSYNGTLDSVIEAEIADRITDDPVDMIEYVGECQYGMLALDTAVALAEGQLSVDFMRARDAGDESTMESVMIAMEGVLGDAWEKLKEWVKKIYNAIKDFVIKYWNKLRGYIDIFRGMIGKYGDVLRDKDCDSAQVRWRKIDIQNGATYYNATFNKVKGQIANLKDKDDIAGRDSDDVSIYNNNSAQFFRRQLEKAIYGVAPNANGSEGAISTEEKSFGEVRREAIEAADIGGAKKYVDYVLKMGDTGMKDSLKAIDDAEKAYGDIRDEEVSDDSKNNKPDKEMHRNKLTNLRRGINVLSTIHRTGSTVLTNAAKMKVNLAVKACRDALMYHREHGSGRYKNSEESTSSIDSLMATIM